MLSCPMTLTSPLRRLRHRRQKMPVFSTRTTVKAEAGKILSPGFCRNPGPGRIFRGGYRAGGLLLAEGQGSHPAGYAQHQNRTAGPHPADGGRLWTFPVPGAGCRDIQIAGELLPLPTFIQPELHLRSYMITLCVVSAIGAVICSNTIGGGLLALLKFHANTDTLPMLALLVLWRRASAISSSRNISVWTKPTLAPTSTCSSRWRCLSCCST